MFFFLYDKSVQMMLQGGESFAVFLSAFVQGCTKNTATDCKAWDAMPRHAKGHAKQRKSSTASTYLNLPQPHNLLCFVVPQRNSTDLRTC